MHKSCKCICKFDGRKCHSNQCWITINVDVSVKKYICEKDHIWSPATCSYKNGKYLASIIDN